ncbi:hypothetical protein HMPREF1604_02325 [Escherichia coli 908519]|nr:hypothetical protein HMPREF1604_02325 [Escherichia coli 908519]
MIYRCVICLNLVLWFSFFNNLRSSFHDFPLPFSTESGIFYPHLQNQVPGLEPQGKIT